MTDDQTSAKAIMAIHKKTGAPISSVKDFIQNESPLLVEKLVEAAETQEDSTLRDPLEFDPEYAPIIQAVQNQAQRIAESQIEGAHVKGMVHLVWRTMKKILKEEHNLEWSSPAEMNPWNCFD